MKKEKEKETNRNARGKTAHLSARSQRWLYVISDMLMTYVAFLVFDVFRALTYDSREPDILRFLTQTKILLEQFLIPLILLGVYWLSGFYNRVFHKSRLEEITQTFGSALFSTALISLLILTNDMGASISSNLKLLAILLGLLFGFVYIGRLTITTQTARRFKKSDWSFKTIIVGNSDMSRKLAGRLRESDSKFGFKVIGYVPIEHESSASDNERLIRIEILPEVCETEHIDQILICPESKPVEKVLRVLNRLFPLGVSVRIAPDILSYVTSSINLRDIYGEPLVDLTSPRLSDCSRNVKRAFDMTASLLAMIVLSPVYAAVALAVKFDSPGPVIYSQERVGRLQKPFRIYKFRSMVKDAEKGTPRLSHDADPRITRIGHFLRKYRLDEIPQFYNVLRGDMSIVGPRPERSHFVKKIIERAPYYSLIFQTRPGITSWGMVKYGYASTVDEMIRRMHYDLIYLSNMSLSIDLKIMIYTVRTILTGKGK